MRLLNGHKIASIASLVIFTAVFAAEANGQSILGEILRRLDTHNKSLQSLRAEVTMVKHNPQLNVSDTTSGTTSYLPKTAKRGMYVRIDWTKPVEEQISVIGDDYELYRPRLNQVIVGKVQKAKNNASVGGALAFMSMTRDQLRANYDVRYIGEEQIRGGTPTWRLELTPKTETSYKMAELWVDGDGMPRQAKIVEHNNDSTTVLLTGIQKNLTLKGDIFKLKYPANVKKIKA
ncbi:MAG: outer membrane lipoprotein carrier protein LolA [Acidobacteriota bacterium]|nr:MAG: outer membrane lipoprotein carrier protein LolA [Acidobacteriota bacterium]